MRRIITLCYHINKENINYSKKNYLYDSSLVAFYRDSRYDYPLYRYTILTIMKNDNTNNSDNKYDDDDNE